MQVICNLLLSEISVFTKVTNTGELFTYFIHSKKEYINRVGRVLTFMTISHKIKTKANRGIVTRDNGGKNVKKMV